MILPYGHYHHCGRRGGSSGPHGVCRFGGRAGTTTYFRRLFRCRAIAPLVCRGLFRGRAFPAAGNVVGPAGPDLCRRHRGGRAGVGQLHRPDRIDPACSCPISSARRLSSPAEFLERRYSPATRGLFAVLSILFLVLGVLVPALYVGGWVLSEAGFNVPLSTANGIPWVFFVCVAAIAVVCVAGRSDRRLDGRRLGRRGAIPGRCHRRNRISPSWQPTMPADWRPLGEQRPGANLAAAVIASWHASLGRHACLRAFDRVLEHGRQSAWWCSAAWGREANGMHAWVRSWAACCYCSCRRYLSCRAWRRR